MALDVLALLFEMKWEMSASVNKTTILQASPQAVTFSNYALCPRSDPGSVSIYSKSASAT